MSLNKILYGEVQLISLIIGISIIIVGLISSKLISLYFKHLLRNKIKKEYSKIIVKILNYVFLIIILMIAMPLLGFKLSGLLVTGGIIGIAIAFASQNIVSNLLSGIFILMERPINIGNAVNIDGTVGIVEDIQIISTTLRTFDGLYIRLPNQKVFTSNIINYEANVARRFEYKIGIRYMDDANKAIDIIKKIIEAEPLALKNPEPLIFVSELGDSSVNIIVRPWAPVSEWYSLYKTLLWKLKMALEAEGIQIPFPQRVVWYGEKKPIHSD